MTVSVTTQQTHVDHFFAPVKAADADGRAPSAGLWGAMNTSGLSAYYTVPASAIVTLS
jgi:hypothetical protein